MDKSAATQFSAVYFYGTCLVDLFYPKAGMAAIQLLQRQQIEVIYPQAQSCCGQPAFNSGYRNEARDVIAAQIALFKKDLPIIVPSASCAGMIKHHWPELFANTAAQEKVAQIAARTFELTEFLVKYLHISLQDLGEPLQVAVHSSCSAQRQMQVAEHIHSLLQQLDNVDIQTHQYATECCGFGGTFAVKQADLSGAMVEAKTQHLSASGAQRVISQDCGCLMNIGGALKKHKNQLGTQHIAEFLLERTT